ncbi:MAG: 16S rRNA (uracil(1498)-N(3))-methyltransferase, partial [Planctomycetaceae bacterium]|nr:16S rRNA (uracil(1498)-N(3))-methyltransferase [Planctomycetaceae bacterium]
RVMRVKSGCMITLFDGNGHELTAEITGTRKDRLSLRILETRDVDTEPQRQVTIAVSLPKGDRQKWLVEKLTELGCHRMIPLQTERGIAQCSDQVLERLRRQVIEATKQCNRSRLMQISSERTIVDCVAENMPCDSVNKTSGRTGWIAHPRSDGDYGQWDLTRLLQTALPQRVLVFVGPEGGFTRQEVEQAAAFGVQPLDLGPRILRVETAAMMLTTMITACVSEVAACSRYATSSLDILDRTSWKTRSKTMPEVQELVSPKVSEVDG